MDSGDARRELMYLFLFLAVLIALAFSWCILSTCLGPQITGPLRELWDAAVRSPRSTTQSYVRSGVPSSRRRRELGFSEDRYTDDIELWERNMEARGRIE